MKRLTGILTALLCVAFATSSLAQGQPEKRKVVIAAGSTAGFYSLPLTVTSRLGLFKEAGLEPEIIDFPGGTKAAEAMLGGSADVVSGAYEHTIHLQARGEYLQVFVLQGIYPGFAFALKPDKAKTYRSPKDLKGLKIGVSTPGSGTNQLVNYLLAKDGLKPDDVVIVGVGTGAGAVAAMERGEIDGLANIDPIMTQVTNSGHAVVIAEARTKAGTEAIFGSALPSASLYSTEDFIRKNPNTIQALTDAMVRGLRWLHRATPEQLAEVVPPAWLKVNKEFYFAAFRNQREVFSRDGRVPPEAAVKQLEIVRSYSPRVQAANVDVSRTYTNRFVDSALTRVK